MTHQSSDSPILGTPDSPDLLNRGQLAQQVAVGIMSTPTDSGFVLSVEGPWGCGKTSLLNLIVKEFEKSFARKEQPIACWFNPWIVGNAETLVQSFLIQLAASIGFTDHAKNGEKVAKELLSYSSIFTALKFIPGAEPWTTMVKDVFDAVGTATQKISNLKNLDIEKRKTAVIKALQNIGRRIVVFVDDLDRLPPEDVFSMVPSR
jgi:predicted KAP-like P-loop ATPase